MMREDEAGRRDDEKPVQPIPCIRSETLFGDMNEVVLVHEGQYYRLRRTRNGKLILNK